MTNHKRAPESALFFNLTSPVQDTYEDLEVRSSSKAPLNTEATLLQTLLLQDGHARDLGARIEERAGGRFFMHQHEIHWTLRRLERYGWVEAYRLEAANRPSPRIYRLTAEGHRVAERDRRALCDLLGVPAPANASLAP